MRALPVKLTYIGGPTALIEISGVRLVTDPTFDPAGTEYSTALYTLKKTIGPALAPESLGPVEVVLLSHDHHFDNLDRAGKAWLENAGMVLTTVAGAKRLEGGAIGLEAWQTVEVRAPGGDVLQITATPARHGPVDGDRGPVVGFAVALRSEPHRVVYLSGDTVWYEGVAEVARRYEVDIAFLFMGAARVAAVGPAHLTFTAQEAVEAARAFEEALIVPLHYEGWGHFSEGRQEIDKAFVEAGMRKRLHWAEAGRESEL